MVGKVRKKIAALSQEQQGFEGLLAADATQRLDRGQRDVVVCVPSQLSQLGDSSRALAPTQDLRGVTDDGHVLVVGEIEQQLVDGLGGRRERVDQAGDFGFVFACAAQRLDQNRHRPGLRGGQRADDRAPHCPIRVDQLIDQLQQAGHARSRQVSDLFQAFAFAEGRASRSGVHAGLDLSPALAASASTASAWLRLVVRILAIWAEIDSISRPKSATPLAC